MHDNSACNGVNSKCHSVCRVTCNRGFKLFGSHYLTCQGDGKWSGVLGTCEGLIINSCLLKLRKDFVCFLEKCGKYRVTIVSNYRFSSFRYRTSERCLSNINVRVL